MEQLETIKGKSIIVPKMANRYSVLYYDYSGWKANSFNLFTTPEGAIEDFLRWQQTISDEKYRAKYYKVFELELEIPFIPEK